MASLFWVGGSATWNATAGTKWSTTSGGASGAAAPTAADDVFFDAASGVVSVDTAAGGVACRSLNFTGFTGTFAPPAASTVSIGDGTAGAGNIALKMVAGMTFTPGNQQTTIISFVSTSATQQTIDTGGKNMCSLTWNGAGSSYIPVANVTCTGTGVMLHLQGALDWGGFNWTGANGFTSNGTLTRTLSLGSGTGTFSSSGNIWLLTTTGMTFNAGTSNLVLTSVTGTVGTATLPHNNVSINAGNSGTASVNANIGGSTFNNLTLTTGAIKTGIISLTSGSAITVNGVFLCTGNSVTNRVLVASNVAGTARSIIVNGSHGAHANVDFQDVAVTGTAGTLTGTSIGNCTGNTNITFDTPVTQTATGTASFTWSTHTWTTRVPLPQDDVIINNAFIAGRTITVDMPRLGKSVNASAATGSPAFTWNTPISSYGDLAMASGITASGSTSTWSLNGRGSQTITNNGATWANTSRLSVNSFGGTYTMQDAMTMVANASPSSITATLGTLALGSFNHTFGQLIGATGATISGTGNITLNSTAVGNLLSIAAGTTWSATTATFVIATSTAARTWAGGGKSYASLDYSVAGSTGALTISGNNTFGTFNFSDASNTRTLSLTSGSSNAITNWNVNGTAGKLMVLNSTVGGSAATLTFATQASSDYLSVQDNTAAGVTPAYAGVNGTLVSGTTSWLATAPPPPNLSRSLLLMGIG